MKSLLAEEDLVSQIKKCISFIHTADEKGTHPIGTGFWVFVKKEKDATRQVGYFVTAKHVLLDQNDKFLPQIRLRQSTLDGKLFFAPLEIGGKNPLFTHTDDEVDIAVLQVTPNPKIIDFKGIESELINTKQTVKDVGIREGDDVFFAGLFASFLGAEKNHPIFRFGKIALLTDEKITWRERGKTIQANLYLVECQSFGGNSGSPVFFNLSPMRVPGVISVGGSKISLAGIVKGSFLDASEVVKSNKSNEEKLVSFENVGISAVTPAYQLHEILFREDIVKLRDETK